MIPCSASTTAGSVARGADIKHYIKLGQAGAGFLIGRAGGVLIDEVDKADIEFPNDLLNELDE